MDRTAARPLIRPATAADFEAIWPIFHEVVAGEDAFAFSGDTTPEEARRLWMGPGMSVYVAEIDGAIVGSYYIKPNQPGLGAHVANAGYMVAHDAAGRGVGTAMGEHSLSEARALGFEAMQFNFVVGANARAVALWRRLGFRIVGTVPRAFRHRTLGLVDVHIMHRFLDSGIRGDPAGSSRLRWLWRLLAVALAASGWLLLKECG